MKKIVFSIAIVLLVFAACKKSNNDRRKEHEPYAVNRVKTEKSYTIEYNEGKPDTAGKTLTSEREFDQEGNLVKETNYKRSFMGEGTTIRSYTYNKEGELTEMQETTDKGALKMKVTFTLDDKGFVTLGVLTDDAGKYMRRVEFKNDDKGNHIEEKQFGEDSALISKNVNVFDDEGRLTETSTFDEREKLQGRTTYKYGKGDVIIEKIEYDAAGKAQNRITVEYPEDEFNLSLKYQSFDADSVKPGYSVVSTITPAENNAVTREAKSYFSDEYSSKKIYTHIGKKGARLTARIVDYDKDGVPTSERVNEYTYW